MKKLAVVCCLIVMPMLGLWAASAAVTDFSGTWVLDPDKSQGLYDESTWTITQDDKQIAVSHFNALHPGGSMSGTDTYKLDGSETVKEINGHVQVVGPGTDGVPQTLSTILVKLVRNAKWLDDGKALELTRLRVFSDGTLSETDRLELADNGKTLKLQSRSESTSPTMPKQKGGNYIYTRK